MNQEKIMKTKMTIALVMAILAIICSIILAGMYSDERVKTQVTFRDKYAQNLEYAYNEINTYLETKKDLPLHYNMVLSDVGAARTLIFVIENISEEKQTIVNTFHYSLVKYPDQMQEKLEDIAQALYDVSGNLDKGYDEMKQITDSIDLLGT